MGCFRLHIENESNLRVAYSKKLEKPLKKTVHYYPFGLKHKGYNNVVSSNGNSVAQKFKFNGMELENSLGIDWYEMDMRQYDPAIARWTVIDPVTHHSMSTYNAFDNNPVFWADPSGANSVRWEGNYGPDSAEAASRRRDEAANESSGGCPDGKICDDEGNVIGDEEPDAVKKMKEMIDPAAFFARLGLAISNYFKKPKKTEKKKKEDGIKIFGGSHKVYEQSYKDTYVGPLLDILETSQEHSVKTYGEDGVLNLSTKTVFRGLDGKAVEHSKRWSLKADIGEFNTSFSTSGLSLSHSANFGENSYGLSIGLNHQAMPTISFSGSNKIGGVTNKSKVKFTPGLGTRLAALAVASGAAAGSPVMIPLLFGI